MVAAACAIFEDMTQRGILQPLMHEEQGGMDRPPQQQDMGGQHLEAGTAAAGGSGSSRESACGRAGAAGSDGDGRAQYPGSGPGRQQPGGTGGQDPASREGRQVNRQSSGNRGPGGRLWEGKGHSAAAPEGAGGSSGARVGRRQRVTDDGAEEWRKLEEGRPVQGTLGEGEGEQEAGRQVGSLMRRLVEEEGWAFIVQGHRWGRGGCSLTC